MIVSNRSKSSLLGAMGAMVYQDDRYIGLVEIPAPCRGGIPIPHILAYKKAPSHILAYKKAPIYL